MYKNFDSFQFLFVFAKTETEQGIFEQVLRGELDFTSDPWPTISESAKDLVRKMLVRDPKKRLTAHEVLCMSLISIVIFVSFSFQFLIWI